MTPVDSEQTLKTLVELVSQGNCVLFLGNDQPLGFPGSAPPCQDELAAVLAREIAYSGPTDKNLAEIALFYEGSRGRHALTQRVRDLLQNPAYQTTALHQQVATLPFRAIITTAQDELLERALQAAGRSYATVLTDVETPYIEEDKVMVYKIHGCVSRPDSLVLTRTDRCLFNRRLNTYLSVLRYLFVTRPLLFLHYRLDDPLFETIFHEVTADVEEHRRRAYAVWPAVFPTWRDIWARHGLVLLEQEGTAFLDRLARQIVCHERALAAAGPTGPLTKAPYKFLDYYESADRDIFYGRQIEAVRFFRLVLSHPLTVLFGASGTGKTSLLKAGVLPLLEAQGYTTVYVRALGDPLRAVRQGVLDLLRHRGRAAADPGAATLRAFCHAVLDPEDKLVVVLDQFEEFFLRLGDPVRRRFWAELAAFRERALPVVGAPPEPEVRFVLSLREDYLAPLDEARGQIPELLGDSYRLVNLSDDKASTVITEPAARAGLAMAPDLVPALLNDLRETGTIAPPQLQIVCDRLYRDSLADPDAVRQGAAPVLARTQVTRDDYARLGGAAGILGGYVNEALGRLSDEEARARARTLLKVLVTSRATKAAVDWAALQGELAAAGAAGELESAQDREVLGRLVNLRLVREFERGGAALYELAHDHLAAEIATWISQEEMQGKLVRELLWRELDNWRETGLLIRPEVLELIYERRKELRRLGQEELELLFRSAVAVEQELPYWSARARAAGVAVEGILQEGLLSARPDTRADAATTLGELVLPEAVPWLAGALTDDYPHVRARARAALEQIGTAEARQTLQDNPPMEMICVPAGPFIMGDDLGDMDEKPVHEVYLEAFWIARYPVTNGDYARFVACTGHRPPNHWLKGRVPLGKEDHPVVNVTWYDAREYATWAGLRLPTEAEWEKAAGWEESNSLPNSLPLSSLREAEGGGETEGRVEGPPTGRKRRYPWGDEFDHNRCNSCESCIGGTTPVGQYSPVGDSPYGAADMAGNVWEWCSSLYRPYPYRADDRREDPAASGKRVVRGGSWGSRRDDRRCAYRADLHPDSSSDSVGFRCCWSGALGQTGSCSR